MSGRVIAHVLPWEAIGGTELQTLRLAEAARAQSFQSMACVPRGAAKVRGLFEDSCFEVTEYEQIHPSYTKPGAYLRNCHAIAAQFREWGVGVVHCADIPAAYFTALTARFAGARLLCHVRNHYPHMSLRDKGFLYPVERFIFVSKATRDAFAAGFARKRGTVLYDVPGVQFRESGDRAAARAHFGIPQNHAVFGMASRVAPQKDFPTLIEAARLVKRELPASTFLIAGDYRQEPAHREHYASFQHLLDETGTRGNFLFAGFQTDMTRFFAASDVFVLSTHWEGLPTVTLEAILYGKPVVCTDVGGIAEAITHGVNGMLAPAKSPTALAACLLDVIRTPGLAKRLVKNALEGIDAQFGPERFARQVNELYSTVLGPR